jgi:hypothetical protein
MAEEEFTEDDFEDLPPIPGPTQRVIRGAATTNKKIIPQQQQQQQSQSVPQPAATRDVAELKDKYAVYNIPPRMGIFDNELQRPIIEEGEMTAVLLSLLVKIANDVDEIKGRL